MKTRSLIALLAVVVLLAAGWVRLNYRGPGADVTRAAEQFLESLKPEQRKQATIAFDDPARIKWHFIPLATRKGLQVKEMSGPQRQSALALLQSSLSQIGYDKATTIMGLEAILRELEKERKDGAIRDPERYYFTLFGTPHAQGKWGLSVEGHHLSLNFVVSDGQVTAVTPSFFGANPATVMTELPLGAKKGTRVLAQEEELGFTLINSCSPEQRKTALIAELAPKEIRTAGEPLPPDAPPAGLRAAEMKPEQIKTLRALLATYTGNMPKEIAESRLSEMEREGLEKVYFSWSGATKPGIGHYYVVQGPTFVLEFINTQPDSAGNPANHIHSVWRDLRGDFGIAKK